MEPMGSMECSITRFSIRPSRTGRGKGEIPAYRILAADEDCSE